MTEIVSRIRQTRQPQGAASIDWSNPITRGLVFCAVPVGGTYIDLVTGVFGTRAGTITSGVYGANGGNSRRADVVIASQANGSTSDIVSWPASATQRGGSLTQVGTLLALAGTTEQVDAKRYAIIGNCEPTNGHGFGLGIDSYSTTINRGALIKYHYDYRGNSTPSMVGNPFGQKTHFFGYSFNGNGANGNWFGSRSAVAFSGLSTHGTTTTGRQAVVCAAYPNSAYGIPAHNGYVALGLMWDRELSLDEYVSLYDNPWQLFAPITRRIWVPSTAAGGDTSITPSSGALALTGYAPTAVTPLSAAPSTGQLVIGGYAPSVTSTLSASPSAGALTLTGYAPTAVATLSAAPSAGALILTGYAPTALTSLSVSPTTGQLVFTGAAPTATVSLSAAPSAGAFTLSGYSPSITVGAPTISISPNTGQIVVTGYAPTISGWDTAITPGVGALVIAGYAPTYSGATTIIFPATGALSLAGYAPTADTTGPVDISIGVGALLLTGYIPTISNSGDLWRVIDTAQSPSWSTIGTTQSANWQIINTH